MDQQAVPNGDATKNALSSVGNEPDDAGVRPGCDGRLGR